MKWVVDSDGNNIKHDNNGNVIMIVDKEGYILKPDKKGKFKKVNHVDGLPIYENE
jgi:hypothetical protein